MIMERALTQLKGTLTYRPQPNRRLVISEIGMAFRILNSHQVVRSNQKFMVTVLQSVTIFSMVKLRQHKKAQLKRKRLTSSTINGRKNLSQ